MDGKRVERADERQRRRARQIGDEPHLSQFLEHARRQNNERNRQSRERKFRKHRRAADVSQRRRRSCVRSRTRIVLVSATAPQKRVRRLSRSRR